MCTGMLRHVLFAVLLALWGCAAPTFNKVTYDGPANIESGYSATVTLVPVTPSSKQFSTLIWFIYWIPIPIPVSTPAVAMFSVDDQKVVLSSLIDGLNRLRILTVRDAPDPNLGKTDLRIRVTFLRAEVQQSHIDTYTIEVELQICNDERCAIERYDVTSQEPETSWQHLLFSPVQAKERVAKRILAKIIPSIEHFVAEQE